MVEIQRMGEIVKSKLKGWVKMLVYVTSAFKKSVLFSSTKRENLCLMTFSFVSMAIWAQVESLLVC